MRLIVDAQLPPLLAEELRRAGCDAVAVREIGLRDAKDSEIWNYAISIGAAIVTKDEDFAERCIHSQESPAVIWVRIGNASNTALLARFMPNLSQALIKLSAGDRLIEIR